jgi:hypothetical protein
VDVPTDHDGYTDRTEQDERSTRAAERTHQATS